MTIDDYSARQFRRRRILATTWAVLLLAFITGALASAGRSSSITHHQLDHDRASYCDLSYTQGTSAYQRCVDG